MNFLFVSFKDSAGNRLGVELGFGRLALFSLAFDCHFHARRLAFNSTLGERLGCQQWLPAHILRNIVERVVFFLTLAERFQGRCLIGSGKVLRIVPILGPFLGELVQPSQQSAMIGLV